jgi:RNA polymerase sigma factor (sigma-70 family)
MHFASPELGPARADGRGVANLDRDEVQRSRSIAQGRAWLAVSDGCEGRFRGGSQDVSGSVADGVDPLTSAACARSPVPPQVAASTASSRGDVADFPTFFHAHRDRLHRFLWRLTGNAADAEDLVQETFLTVWRKRGQFEGRGSAEGWLRRTAFRLFLNQKTKSRRRRALADAAPARRPDVVEPSDRALAEDEARAYLLERIAEAVDELPDDPRHAFVLFRYEGLTCAEIADATGAPVKTVETRLRRATELLAQKVRRFREKAEGA